MEVVVAESAKHKAEGTPGKELRYQCKCGNLAIEVQDAQTNGNASFPTA